MASKKQLHRKSRIPGYIPDHRLNLNNLLKRLEDTGIKIKVIDVRTSQFPKRIVIHTPKLKNESEFIPKLPKKIKKERLINIRFSKKEKIKIQEIWSEELHKFIRPRPIFKKTQKEFNYDLWLEKYKKHRDNETKRKNTIISSES